MRAQPVELKIYSLHKEQEGEGISTIHDPYLPLILCLKYLNLAIHKFSNFRVLVVAN